MKVIKQFIEWWKSLEFKSQDEIKYTKYKDLPEENKSWCPFCRYKGGTLDNLNAHLLNHHRN